MELFKIDKEPVSTKQLVLLVFLAYAFSVLVRMIWVYQFSGFDTFYWNNELMINTNDGYFWASGAQAFLDGLHQENPRVPDYLQYGVTFFTILLVKITPFTLESIILYMPSFISSLVVVPIILIARLYGLSILGFFSALIGSIAWSYYNRTMVGYYDTDMFSAMAPMFILYFLFRTIEKKDFSSALMASLSVLIYPFLYDAGHSIVFAMGILYFIYMFVYHRNEDFTYQSIALISIGLLKVFFLIKIILLVLAFGMFYRGYLKRKELMILSLLSVGAFLLYGNIYNLIWGKVSTYLIRGTEEIGLHFFQVKQTVREAGQIPFSTMANRISGSTLGVLSAFIGYILLVIQYRPFILALPLIGIGVFSLWGGLRFTVYAVPIAAISSVFLFYVIAVLSEKKTMRYVVISFLTILMLYPNISHIIAYKVPTVFSKNEVEVLDKLKNASNPKDYTIAWWDYGYPIWFYSNTNTLIDGGKHNHDNFIVSKILTTTSQVQAANLARLSIETYVDSNYSVVADTLFHNKTKEQIKPNLVLDELQLSDFELPKKTRDIYFYLPFKMLNILPTVEVFSNINLETGEQDKRSFFYKTRQYRDVGDKISLGNNIELLKNGGKIKVGNQEIPVGEFIVTEYRNGRTLNVSRQTLNFGANLSVIFMKSYNQFLVVDSKILNSTYIKMFVLEEYDKNLFEAVVLTPHAKVYKLKV